MVSVTAINSQPIRGRTESQHWLAWLFCSVSKKWTCSLGIYYAHNLRAWLQVISLTIGMPGSRLKLIFLQCRYNATFCFLVKRQAYWELEPYWRLLWLPWAYLASPCLPEYLQLKAPFIPGMNGAFLRRKAQSLSCTFLVLHTSESPGIHHYYQQ